MVLPPLISLTQLEESDLWEMRFGNGMLGAKTSRPNPNADAPATLVLDDIFCNRPTGTHYRMMSAKHELCWELFKYPSRSNARLSRAQLTAAGGCMATLGRGTQGFWSSSYLTGAVGHTAQIPDMAVKSLLLKGPAANPLQIKRKECS